MMVDLQRQYLNGPLTVLSGYIPCAGMKGYDRERSSEEGKPK